MPFEVGPLGHPGGPSEPGVVLGSAPAVYGVAVLCHDCYGEASAMADCGACRGTGRATRMPLPDEPWNEVAPGLFMGGHDVRSQSTTACVVTDQFDLVVSLASREGYGPDEAVEHVIDRFADAGLNAAASGRVTALVDLIVPALGEGRRVLVRCSGGLNRSGVVVASVLIRQGYGVEEAMAAVRAARGPWALTNPTFVAHLRGLA